MYKTLFARLVVSLALIGYAGAASAATVTFSSLTGSNLDVFTGVTEDGVTVTPLSTLREAHVVGNPVPGIVLTNFAGFLDGTSGAFEVTMGGLFTFESFDLGTGGAAGPRYSVTGFLGAAEVFSSTGQNASSGWFTISSPDSFAALDRLVISAFLNDVTGATLTTSANFDNIVLGDATVPEPGTLALIVSGLGLLVLRRKTTA
jgi:hypothetical protein